MSYRVSLRGMLRLIRFDALRRVQHVGFSRDGAYVSSEHIDPTERKHTLIWLDVYCSQNTACSLY